MNNCNYSFFEILKYKIEFTNCLEYSMENCDVKDDEVERNIIYLKNNLKNGEYRNIVAFLFTKYKLINGSLMSFFNHYSSKKINKIKTTNKARNKIKYIKKIIEGEQTLLNILHTFINEKQIYDLLNENLLHLFNTSCEHFQYFLYFVLYQMYVASNYADRSNLLFKQNDIKEIVSLIKYANSSNYFEKSIKILEENDELKINNELERLSRKCIELEKKLHKELNEFISLINQEIEKSKK